MANKKFWLGMLVLVLVFGMTVTGCDNGTTGGGGGTGGGNDTNGGGESNIFPVELRTWEEFLADIIIPEVPLAERDAFIAAVQPGFYGWFGERPGMFNLIVWTGRTAEQFNALAEFWSDIFGVAFGTAVIESGAHQRWEQGGDRSEGNITFFTLTITGPWNGTNIYLNMPAGSRIVPRTVMLYIR